MAKSKAPSIHEIEKQLKQKKILPIYYLFGEDSYSIENIVESIEKAVEPFITSDFDKETVYGENKTFSNVVELASTFPFGSEKKLIIFKQSEKPRDKKEFTSYIKSPADFTTIICIHDGTISSTSSEPYKTLIESRLSLRSKRVKREKLN